MKQMLHRYETLNCYHQKEKHQRPGKSHCENIKNSFKKLALIWLFYQEGNELCWLPSTCYKSVLQSHEAGGGKLNMFIVYINIEILTFYREQYWGSDFITRKKRPNINQKWIIFFFSKNNQVKNYLSSVFLFIHPSVHLSINLLKYTSHKEMARIPLSSARKKGLPDIHQN